MHCDYSLYLSIIHILQALYNGLDTGKGWSTVHLQLNEMISSLSGQPANVRIQVIPDQTGTIMIAGMDSLTIANGVCRHMGKWCNAMMVNHKLWKQTIHAVSCGLWTTQIYFKKPLEIILIACHQNNVLFTKLRSTTFWQCCPLTCKVMWYHYN